MISQIRIYSIHPGKMDEWIALFNERIAPLHVKNGIAILGAWADREKDEFIWIRSYEDADDMEARNKIYGASPERQALGDLPASFHGAMDVRTIEYVYQPTVAPLA